MEKTIEIQLKEHGERIAKAIENLEAHEDFELKDPIKGTWHRLSDDWRTTTAKIARTTK